MWRKSLWWWLCHRRLSPWGIRWSRSRGSASRINRFFFFLLLFLLFRKRHKFIMISSRYHTLIWENIFLIMSSQLIPCSRRFRHFLVSMNTEVFPRLVLRDLLESASFRTSFIESVKINRGLGNLWSRSHRFSGLLSKSQDLFEEFPSLLHQLRLNRDICWKQFLQNVLSVIWRGMFRGGSGLRLRFALGFGGSRSCRGSSSRVSLGGLRWRDGTRASDRFSVVQTIILSEARSGSWTL